MSYFKVWLSKKNMFQVTFENNNLLRKKGDKITCHEVKAPPPGISNGPSLKRGGQRSTVMLHSLLLEFMVITTCEMVFTSGEHADRT